MTTRTQSSMPNVLPLLPLRDIVVFPRMVITLFMGRAKSIKAVETAMNRDKRILLVAQRNGQIDDPASQDLFTVGCVGQVLQMLRLPDQTVKILVEGKERVDVSRVLELDGYLTAAASPRPMADSDPSETEALRRAVIDAFTTYAGLNPKIPEDLVRSVSQTEDAMRLADVVAQQLPIPVEKKQRLLESDQLTGTLTQLLELLGGETEIQQIEKRIHGRVKQQMEKNQRDYYLNEQIKAIQKELGEEDEAEGDLAEYEKKIRAARMSKEGEEKAFSELKKLRQMSPMSAEATVVRAYLDTLISLPWSRHTKVQTDIVRAKKILDEDHYGLEKVKERILEYLAVQARVKKVKSPILCLVGAPGVGKTSLGESIARATGRKFTRLALGGVHDEAEIRGHRRTYVGSMPGKILQNLIKVGVNNPLFLLDEVDKMGMDYRGDPASALLEVLDPEQNSKFSDHYAEVEFDLSNVLFVATSNSYNIPPALLDRMEVISLSGYTEEEKIHIAEEHLIPKQLRMNGLKAKELKIDRSAIVAIIRYYTREAGVRGLEREISKICRKVVMAIMMGDPKTKTRTGRAKCVTVTEDNVGDYLGVRRFTYGIAWKQPRVGQVNGLAWTEVGGDLLSIEAAAFPGKGVVQRTGSLGEVMKESVEAARSVVRERARSLGIKDEAFAKTDLHLHFPEGATPKDGPSAGGAITTAIVSALTGIPVRPDVAMTGEITLRGEILEIGGLKEKLLAALRGGIKKVLIPEDNVKDLAEIPQNVRDGLEIVPVRWIEQVLEQALVEMPKPLPEPEPQSAAPAIPPAAEKSKASSGLVAH
ncbi:endopeptidase La [Mesosutterella sp. AGMB02718]|uniref:Lon protease n=1 Tax=Mesosutterella faecium TaxID=2925194 RepID=A0ABT7IPJ5_9BURK|nr:endopeptidase La [Mesosutterella sp. AGMB02718]MDL2060310.1 endopeptidase La [Mesosutterella sp. AGMB02718]